MPPCVGCFHGDGPPPIPPGPMPPCVGCFHGSSSYPSRTHATLCWVFPWVLLLSLQDPCHLVLGVSMGPPPIPPGPMPPCVGCFHGSSSYPSRTHATLCWVFPWVLLLSLQDPCHLVLGVSMGPPPIPPGPMPPCVGCFHGSSSYPSRTHATLCWVFPWVLLLSLQDPCHLVLGVSMGPPPIPPGPMPPCVGCFHGSSSYPSRTHAEPQGYSCPVLARPHLPV